MAGYGVLASITITTFLVIVLLRACWHKIDRFLETVGFAQGYGLVPDSWAAPAVRALSLAEALAILALAIPATRQTGGLIAAALFAGYGLLMTAALTQGRRHIDCGCGGPPQVVSAFTLGRNLVLTLLASAVAVLPVASARPAEATAAIAAALILCATYAVIERLASHLPYIRHGNG